MRRRLGTWVALLVVSCAAALAPTPAAAAETADGPTWYAMALSRGEGGLNVTYFWSRGPWLRAETVIGGHKIVTIVRDGWYYTYDSVAMQGLAIERDASAVARDAPDRRPFGDEYTTLISQGAELIEEQELMGRRTGKLRITDEFGRRQLQVTLDDDRLPLRLEVYDRRSTSNHTTDYVDWKQGVSIADGFFEPDSGVALERMTFDAYMARTLAEGPIGPVPVLYTNLLHDRAGRP
jgi:hypothetical protein